MPLDDNASRKWASINRAAACIFTPGDPPHSPCPNLNQFSIRRSCPPTDFLSSPFLPSCLPSTFQEALHIPVGASVAAVRLRCEGCNWQCILCGWSRGSNVPERYRHTSSHSTRVEQHQTGRLRGALVRHKRGLQHREQADTERLPNALRHRHMAIE